ncbi:MAG: peptide deformylase [Bacteroidota bacterium]
MQIIQGQCKKQSRNVKIEDLPRVKREALEMLALCHKPLGRFPYALALAHCQVEHLDPLQFFVTKDAQLIINPKILYANRKGKNQTEGCMSYAFRSEVTVRRYESIQVKYQQLDREGNIIEKEQEFTDLMARIFQHEIDHFNTYSIYGH